MNKIEFMAWDKTNKKWLETYYNHVFHIPIKTENYALRMIEWDDVSEEGYCYKEFTSDEVELMQLTALRSINDEPIYNHMIVRDINSGNFMCVDMFNYELMSWLNNYSLEIVGNRFQHPELLELCR